MSHVSQTQEEGLHDQKGSKRILLVDDEPDSCLDMLGMNASRIQTQLKLYKNLDLTIMI